MVNDPTQFRPRRTKSRHADDKAVDDFTRVVAQTGILNPLDPVDELAALIGKDQPTADDLERIGKLLNDE
jgi:hypothetical protein